MWGWVIGRLGGFAGLGGSGEKSWIESPVSIIELAVLYTPRQRQCNYCDRLYSYSPDGGPFCTGYSTLAAGRNLDAVRHLVVALLMNVPAARAFDKMLVPTNTRDVQVLKHMA